MKLQPLALLSIAIAAGVAAPASAHAAVSSEAHARAADRCEHAVADTIERVRGKDVRDVVFVGERRAISTDGEDIGVKGEGRYRRGGSAQAFTYSCAFNTGSEKTSGVVFQDKVDAVASAEARAAWQPDLSQVSPDACETTVAALLKDKHPRVNGIAFHSETRALSPAASGQLRLEGQGSLQRAPGMNAAPFRYRCDFDARSGRVLAAQAQD